MQDKDNIYRRIIPTQPKNQNASLNPNSDGQNPREKRKHQLQSISNINGSLDTMGQKDKPKQDSEHRSPLDDEGGKMVVNMNKKKCGAR